ncbi:MAG: hypothetical protein ACI8QY_000391, partial [bacterium]
LQDVYVWCMSGIDERCSPYGRPLAQVPHRLLRLRYVSNPLIGFDVHHLLLKT